MRFVGLALSFSGVVLFVLFAIGSSSCVQKQLTVGREIGAPLNRAQVAAEPQEMDQFLEKVQTGMEKHGYTQGNWTKINQNVDNDFAVAYAAILSIRERLQTVKTFDKSSTEYQVAMDDLRGTLRELDIGQQEAVAWEYLWIWFALILSIIFVVVGAIIYETNRDYI